MCLFPKYADYKKDNIKLSMELTEQQIKEFAIAIGEIIKTRGMI